MVFPFSIEVCGTTSVFVKAAFGGACSCAVPQVEPTWPLSCSSLECVRYRMVEPRMSHAAVAHKKMKIKAAIWRSNGSPSSDWQSLHTQQEHFRRSWHRRKGLRNKRRIQACQERHVRAWRDTPWKERKGMGGSCLLPPIMITLFLWAAGCLALILFSLLAGFLL